MDNNKFKNYNKKNIDDIPLTDVDYEGVVYEPSNKNDNKSNQKTTTPKKIKKAPSFNYSLFIGSTISLGVIICVVVFWLTFNSGYFNFNTTGKNQNVNTDNNLSVSVIDKINNSAKEEINTGIIKNINTEKNTIELLDFNKNEIYILKVSNSSELKNQYGTSLLLVEFATGDIVNISFDSSNKIISMQKSPNSFYYKNVSNYTLDTSNNVIKLNNKTYSISPNILAYKNLLEIALSDIANSDIIDIKGINNTVYYIEIKKGDGILKFENIPSLTNATIEIDRDTFKSFTGDSINLTEGLHKIVIKADNINSFVKEISIISGEETVIDLSELEQKKGTLLIKTNVSNYILYINNIEEISREPLSLNYGAYSITVQKEEYTPFETQVYINKPQTTVQVNLEKIEKLGQLTISSSPNEAEVYVDNVLVGYTPLTYKLAYGTHNITLKKQGYIDFMLSSVNINELDSVFNVTMHQDTSVTTTEETTFEIITDPVISE